jgi:tetratricopeptide (TPR) repeat protein
MRLFVPLLWTAAVLVAQPTPQVLIDQGHFKRAIVLIEAKYAATPNDAESLCLMSWLKQSRGDLAAAQQLAEKAVAVAPNDAKCHFRLAEALGEEAKDASKLRQIGLGRRFKKEIDTTLALDPKHLGALNYLMQFYLQAPGILGGDTKKAKAVPAQIMPVDPVKAYFAEVALARHEKQEDRVEELYRKAVEARPSSYEARTAYSNYLINAKTPKVAEAELNAREALKLDPGRPSAHTILAAAFAIQQKWPEVDTALAQAEKDVPDNLVPYLRIGNYCLGKNAELPRAERYFRKYLTQSPEPGSPTHAYTHWRLGLVMEREGRKPDAIAEWQTAVRLDPKSNAKDDLKRLK